MFDTNEILARLQNGEDAQTIADEMAALLNEANKVYNDQKAAEAVEKAEVQKREHMELILQDIRAWFNEFYNCEWAKELNDIKAETVIELVDSLVDYVDAFIELEKTLKVKPDVKPAAKPAKKIFKTNSPDDTLNAFLKQMGW